MKDRHINVPQDNNLLRLIQQHVASRLVVDARQRTIRLWIKFIFYLSMSVFFYVGIYYVDNVFLFTISFICYGFFILLLAFNFAHDFSHGTVCKRSYLNDWGFIAIYALNGAHAQSWKKRHIESHHFAPNVENYDTDLQISRLIRVIPNSKHRWFHKYQHFYAPIAYSTYSLYWIFVKDFVVYANDFLSSKFLYHLSFWFQKGFYFSYLIALPLMFSPHSPVIVLTAFLLMHLLQSLFLLFTFFMTHHVEGVEYPSLTHEGHIKSSWIMNQIKSSNDMYPFSRLANFIFGGFNNHIAHHLFPHVHHFHYPDLNRVLYSTLIENGINPNQTTYWGGIRSHLRHLKTLSAK